MGTLPECLPAPLDEIQRLSLFRGVLLMPLMPLLTGCTLRELPVGEVLIAHGQLNHHFYAILAGRLRVYIDTEDYLAILEAGSSVGELSVIDCQPTSACVVAETDCRLLVISEQALWLMVAASHAVATNLLSILTQRLREANTKLTATQKQQRKLAYQATVDVLTGLYNRRWLSEHAPRLCHEAQTSGCALAAILIDIDHFKRYNDTHGHLAGDRAIHALGALLITHLRPMDVAARFGGEEFVVLLPATEIGTAGKIAQHLCEVTRTMLVRTLAGDELPTITCSLGVAQWMLGEPVDTWLRRADLALYQAKQTGRNRVVAEPLE